MFQLFTTEIFRKINFRTLMRAQNFSVINISQFAICIYLQEGVYDLCACGGVVGPVQIVQNLKHAPIFGVVCTKGL